MAADIWEVMKGIHVPGPNVLYVGITGSDANAGTSSGARKRTIEAALSAMPAGGGIIYVGNGDYGNLVLSDNFSNNAWCLIKAENQWGAQMTCQLGGSYIGIYGFHGDGNNSTNPFTFVNGHHLAVWGCHAEYGEGVGIGGAGNNSSIGNVSICYNLINNNAEVNLYAGSGISLFEWTEGYGSQSHTWIGGYDNVIVGNIIHSNTNPSYAMTADGNGIIIDDMRNTQEYAGARRYIAYTGNFLVMNNISLHNHGVGLHVFTTDNVDVVFNTAAHNNYGWDPENQVWRGGNLETSAIYADNCKYIGNVVKPANLDQNGNATGGASAWFGTYLESNITTSANVVLASSQNSGADRMRQSEGFNYFANNAPTLAPADLTQAAQWRPDGGSGAVEKITITQGQYDSWARWPTAFGDYRPADKIWAAGFSEASGGGSPNPTPPVAAFTASDATPDVGQTITFSDLSTGSPTSWLWDFGVTGTSTELPGPGLSPPGTFSGRILLDDAPMVDCLVKVVDAYHPNWTYPGPIQDILNGPGASPGYEDYCKVVTTNSQGDWSVTGLTPGRSYMLKIFPGGVNKPYVANAIVPNGAYQSAELGFIDTGGSNFMSSPGSEAGNTYQRYYDGRYLFDMPNHIYPTAGTPLSGSLGYSDLNVKFYTRESTFYNDGGQVSGGVPLVGGGGGGGGSATSTAQNPSYAWSETGLKTVTLTVTNAVGSSTTTQQYDVGGVPSTVGTITHPALGVHGHLLSSSSDGTTAGGYPRYKISYQMTSISGSIITATGVAAFPGPIGSPPVGGWPIILAGHGATGTDDGAAPSGWSDDMSNAVGYVDSWLDAGYIVVQADYEGLNPANDALPHPYMVGVSAARSLLDAGLACAGLTTVKASAASVGFSQGGHAALFAGEYADSYAATSAITVPSFPSGTGINITTLGVSAGGGDQQTAIQNALNNAASGALIYFPAGTYNHSGVINITKPVTLYSTAGAVLVGTDPLNMALKITGNDVRIEGLEVRGVGTVRQSFDHERACISVVDAARTVIKDCTIVQSSATGIFLEGASDYYVVGNEVRDTLADAIHQTGVTNHGYVLNNTVIDSGDDCIAVVSYGGQDCNNIVIKGNNVSNGGARGISVVGGRDVTIQGNTINVTEAAGIYCASEPSYTTEGVDRIMIRDNILIGVNVDVAKNHGGIFLWGGRPEKPVNDITIYNNTITDTAVGAAHLVIQGSNVFNTNFLDNTTSGSKPHNYIEADSDQWTRGGAVHNSVAVSNYGAPISAPPETDSPFFTQFCSVGFDPVITSDYVNSIYTGQNSDQYLASIIYGQWIENQALVRTVVLSSGASANLPNLESWDFGTTASNINFGNGSFVANPVTAGGGWSTAIYQNTPGHRLARPSRIYSPSGGIGGGSTWLGFALGSGTDASRVVVGGGHEITNVSDAIVWVTNTLASQVGTGAPIASFNFTPSSPQVNNTITFSDASANAPTSWLWNFGDGTTSTAQNPTKSFSTQGTKTVTLTATNAFGSNQTSRSVIVVAAGPPVASFNMSPSPGVVNSTITFTDTSSGAPTSRAWNFGDGATSTATNPTHAYTSAGTYSVSLTVTNAQGSNTTSRTLTIDATGGGNSITLQAEDATMSGTSYPDPEWVMHVTAESVGYSGSGYVGYWGYPGENLTFNLTGITAGQHSLVIRYQKGDVDTPTPRQVYVNGSLITTLNFNRTAADWDSNSWTDTSPLTLTLTSGANTISFRQTGAEGLFVDFDRIVVTSLAPPGNPPVSSFTRSPSGSQNTGVSISFTDTSTNTPTSWNWNFGDGTTSTSQNPSHTYSTAGTKTVTLQAINANGNSTSSQTITITTPVPPSNPPVAAFLVSATVVSVGQTVTFTDQSTATPTSWAWDFGDTATSTLQNPTHAYAAPGTYSVTLTATNADGSDGVSHQVVVLAAPTLDPNAPPPINRYEFTVLAKRGLSLAETNDLKRIMNVFKPAQSRMHIGYLTELVYDDIPIAHVAADSEWWEIVGQVVTRPGTEWAYAVPGDPVTPQEQPRPPFSAYQGEKWSYAGDISSITSYAEELGELRIDYHQRVAFRDGSHFDYRSELGVRWPQDVITERLAADGALVSNPLAVEMVSGKSIWVDRVQETHSRTSRTRSGISPLYFNGVSIEDLALRADSIFSPHRRQAGVPQRFWATSERSKNDPVMESIEMRLRSPQRANRFQFQLAHFPHRAWLESWDAARGEWVSLWSTTIQDSVPTNLTARVDEQHHFHPQHSMNGHWLPFDLALDPVVSSRYRIRMQRLSTGVAPLDSKSAETTYSLGVRGFDVGYVIASRNDIPRVSPSESIGNSVDPLGSRVVYSLRERVARLAVDGDSETAWMSEPQPLGAAVVNFYVDMRSTSGDGQTVDRWYLDPIKPGPNINLYYSNDATLTNLVADDTPLGIQEVAAEGLYVSLGDGISFDDSDPAYFIVPNRLIQFDYTKDWWLGCEMIPRFQAPGADSPIFSFGDFSFQFADESVIFVSPSGNDIVMPFSWHPNQIVRLFISFEAATNTITIGTKAGISLPETMSEVLTHTMVGYPQSVRIAANPSLTTAPNYVLRNLVLNQSTAPDPNDFLLDPEAYILKATYAPQDTGLTNGALLRLHPSFANGYSYPFGLVGGPGDSFAFMNWTPIPRDFRLHKGWIHIPPTKARFWKFEFSQLVMEPIEVQNPIQRVVRLFPMGASFAANDLREDASIDIPAYDAWARRWQTYQDSPAPTDEPDPAKSMPTALVYALDPSGAQRLRSTSWAYGFVPWHVGAVQPRFSREGQHHYDYMSYLHAEKIGFFVGLKEIKAGLSTFQGQDNPQAVVDRFFDTSRLSSSTWSITPGNAWSGQALGSAAVMESKIFPSRNEVSAVQFASQQSDAIQLLPDDEFRDPALAVSEWTDPNRWHTVGDATLSYLTAEQQILVRRAVVTTTTIDPLDQGIMLDPVHPVFSMAAPGEAPPEEEGGVASVFVQTSPNGMLHAAARITALTDLTNPLWVQILDMDGTVLAEESITAKQGDTVEWTASYFLGQYGVEPNYLPDYGYRTIVQDPIHLVFAREEPLEDLNGGPGDQPVIGYLFQVRLVQKGYSRDTWAVDRLSLFDESMIWEFSVDGGQTYIPAYGMRNNPNGLLSFPRSGNALRYRVTAYRANLHISAVQIRPIYIGLPTHRFTNMNRGPNLSVFDQFPPIQDDPEFKRWSKPVPRWWWLEGQNIISVVPVDGYPYSNEFSQTYYRNTVDDLSTQTDTATRIVTYDRDLVEYDTVIDTVGRAGTFSRALSDSLDSISEEIEYEVTAPIAVVVNAGLASATATALDPSTQVGLGAGIAASSGTSLGGAADAEVNAGASSSSATASGAGSSARAQPGSASATGSGKDPTVDSV